MKTIEQQVKTYMETYEMIKKGDRVIAGISGGPDSVCLFFVLLKLREELDLSFVAVHVNHGLRGADADADEQFVRTLCQTYAIPLEVFRVDLEWIAKNRKQSLEEAGREIRREKMMEVMEKYDGDKIALAHHQNDNAETLLWNLARGTGLQGLGGIQPVNGVWIHPLLCLSREEIEQYLEEHQYAYCIDQTNLETDYTRNKLRHQIFPVLEREVNKKAIRHMNQTMEQMLELQEFVRQALGHSVESCVRIEAGKRYISKEMWRRLPVYLQKEVLYDCLEKQSGGKRNLGRSHVRAVYELFEKQVGRKRNLPGGVLATRVYEGICLENVQRAEAFSPRKLPVPGELVLPEQGMTIRCQILERENGWTKEEIPQKQYTKWFDYDIIKCLNVRTRQSGDSLVIDQEGHRQKLKSWFVNEKIPADVRESMLLLAQEDQILWIIGHRMSAAYQVTEKTKRVLQIEIER